MWKKIKHVVISVGIVIVALVVFLLGRRSTGGTGNVGSDGVSIGDIRDTVGSAGDALSGAGEANEAAAEAIHDSSGIVNDIAESNAQGQAGTGRALDAVRTALAAARAAEAENDRRRGD